ncbi:acetyl esterase/lipase [Novosphingobium chloroacetimidivorans]|uniref:Acetyl esterase/lipase n=1 Tax=Novosphingobium chloroacetimidivorans TaxID=1428314 RepID=A0A7W7K839_9SPHN|nr:alpha/beta hydrolase [Novosphingobium chloroacetimidivorans]MBB4857308.1 acetyl esterase/lipase [Novosphingobium chloroacetimidivorans]
MEDARPQFEPNGDVRVPAFVLPVSGLVSPEAAAAQRRRPTVPPIDTSHITDIAERRARFNALTQPAVDRLRARFSVTITPATIAGVRVLDITPADGGHDPDRVLINLHGGAFLLGWDSNALIESIPVAALGRYRVIALDYRMAPEHRHPAALEDVAAVYAALLDTYEAPRIGLYGGSAGGLLAAQAAAWLPRHGLPQVGALGVFGAGGVPFQAGESAYLAGYIDGEYPPPAPGQQGKPDEGYFAGIDPDDPTAWPAYHQDVLANFPPTLLITGTRSIDLSPAIYTNSQLIKAGVRSTLIVGEGMGHCYYYDVGLPEAQDAYAAMIAFFRENLDR